MSNQKIIVLQGIPASGKSTWSKEFVKGKEDWIRVCRDDIRSMRGDYWIPSQESFIDKVEQYAVESALKSGYNVVIDATNFNPKTVAKWMELAQINDTDFDIKRFDIALDEAIRRDSLRERPVGAKVVKDFYHKYVSSKEIKTDTRFILEQNKKLPKCIIVDIDGTLALINGRNPYDDTLVHTDKVNERVADIVNNYRPDYTVFIVSGRQDSCKEVTEKWLRDNHIIYNNLLMRKTGDTRKDSIIKQEIYEEHIKDKYFVEFVLDDRDSVCAMWREQGLLCLQVYYGNF
jgi:predicted kinase